MTTLLLPGLIIAGTNKAGTTSLWSYLAAHPGVAASAVKETCYWLPLRYPGETLEPLDAYRKQWADSDTDKLRMESTPGYFYGGRPLAEAIDAACPDVRIMLLLRHPVDRLVSFFRFKQSTLELPGDMTLRAYVDACRSMSDEQLRQREHNPSFGIEGGLYLKHLPAWMDVFGDRLRVAFFDDLKRDPRKLVVVTCAWLGLDTEAAAHIPLETSNKTVGFRHAGLQRWALRINQVGETFWRQHPAMKRRLRGVYHRLNGKAVTRGDADEQAVRDELDAWYRQRNAGLRALLASHGTSPIPDWVK